MTALCGCDVCQKVCPANVSLHKSISYIDNHAFDIDRLLEASDETLSTLGELLGTNMSKRSTIQAQAALVAGNSGDTQYIDLLNSLAESPNEVIREHAVWAAEKIRDKIREDSKCLSSIT
jgi:epoxyqueuosine reductase QueG